VSSSIHPTTTVNLPMRARADTDAQHRIGAADNASMVSALVSEPTSPGFGSVEMRVNVRSPRLADQASPDPLGQARVAELFTADREPSGPWSNAHRKLKLGQGACLV
jgi:hypothetical protein